MTGGKRGMSFIPKRGDKGTGFELDKGQRDHNLRRQGEHGEKRGEGSPRITFRQVGRKGTRELEKRACALAQKKKRKSLIRQSGEGEA